VLTEALNAAHAIRSERDRAGALVALLPYLPEQRGTVLTEVLTAIRAIGNQSGRFQTLAVLLPHLSPGLLGEVLTAARSIKEERERAGALVALLPYLPEPQRRTVRPRPSAPHAPSSTKGIVLGPW
jgi:hypothetical protein